MLNCINVRINFCTKMSIQTLPALKNQKSTLFRIPCDGKDEIYIKNLQLIDNIITVDMKSNYFAFLTAETLNTYKDSDVVKTYDLNTSTVLTTCTLIRVPIKTYNSLAEVVASINETYAKSLLDCYLKTKLNNALLYIDNTDTGDNLVNLQFYYVNVTKHKGSSYNNILDYIPVLDNGILTLKSIDINIDTENIIAVNNSQEFYIKFKKQDIFLTVSRKAISCDVDVAEVTKLNAELQGDDMVMSVIYDLKTIYIITQHHVMSIGYVFELYIKKLFFQLFDYDEETVRNNTISYSMFSSFVFKHDVANIRILFSSQFMVNHAECFTKLITATTANTITFNDSILPVNIVADLVARINHTSDVTENSTACDTNYPKLEIKDNSINFLNTFPVNTRNYILSTYNADSYSIMGNFMKYNNVINFDNCYDTRIISGNMMTQYIYNSSIITVDNQVVNLKNLSFSNTFEITATELTDASKIKQYIYILYSFNNDIDNFIDNYNNFKTNIIKTVEYPLADNSQTIEIDRSIKTNGNDLFIYLLTDNLYYPFINYRGMLQYSY